MASTNSTVIPAVGYLRKSTKEDGYEQSIADQKARISKLKPSVEGAHYEIIRWYVDPGIPGWKRGHKRPDYFRMVNDLRERQDFVAVLVDDVDRFSRADSMETVHDVQVLRELGVKYIHSTGQGVKDLTQNVAMVAMQIAMEANASHEHCTRLSRRIAERRKNLAAQGKRSGGKAPMGLKNDGDGGLIHGDPDEIAIIRRLFDAVGRLQSLNSLAGELNREGVPTSTKEGTWSTQSIKQYLRNPAYRGDFEYNRWNQGQFYYVDSRGEVVQRNGQPPGPGMLFEKEGVYEPIIDPELFDRVQEHLNSFKNGKRKPRNDSSPLEGILICDHCGRTMYRQQRSATYQCSSNFKLGAGSCGYFSIKESLILPFVLNLLDEEINGLTKLRPTPPPVIQSPNRAKELEKERATLQARINKALPRILEVDDKDTRQDLERIIADWRAELASLNAQMVTADQHNERIEDSKRLRAWWNDMLKRTIPGPGWDERRGSLATQSALRYDCRAVNEALHQLGTEVRLRWRSETRGSRQKHSLDRGRFRLGRHTGDVPTVYCTAQRL